MKQPKHFLIIYSQMLFITIGKHNKLMGMSILPNNNLKMLLDNSTKKKMKISMNQFRKQKFKNKLHI